MLSVLGLLAVLLLVLGVAVDLALRERLRGELEQRLLDRASTAEALVDEVDAEDLVDRLQGEGVSAVLVTADGESFGSLDVEPVQDETDDRPGPGGPGPGAGPGGDPAGPSPPAAAPRMVRSSSPAPCSA